MTSLSKTFAFHFGLKGLIRQWSSLCRDGVYSERHSHWALLRGLQGYISSNALQEIQLCRESCTVADLPVIRSLSTLRESIDILSHLEGDPNLSLIEVHL